jgi:hypothetical protein
MCGSEFETISICRHALPSIAPSVLAKAEAIINAVPSDSADVFFDQTRSVAGGPFGDHECTI